VDHPTPDEATAEDRDVDPRNQLNDLTAREWTYFTRSVWSTQYPAEYGHALRKAHTANKPPRLCRELIEFFTKRGMRVLDPFAGVGGTLLAASLAGRTALGIEIEPRWAALYAAVCASEGIAPQELIVADCRSALPALPAESFDFILTDPPYYQTATARTSADVPRLIAAFSDRAGEVGGLAGYDDFLAALASVFRELHRLLRPGRYAALFMKNRYIGGRFYPMAYDLARRMEAAGFEWRGEHIWNQTGQRLYPFGYPFAYVPNTVHHTIAIFRKPATGRPARNGG
jgi:DNA modification methylase